MLATRTGGCEFEPQPSHTKDLKNGNRYTQLSTKLESDIDKTKRCLSSGRMLCEWLLCPNEKLNALGHPARTLIDNSSPWELKRLFWIKIHNITEHNYPGKNNLQNCKHFIGPVWVSVTQTVYRKLNFLYSFIRFHYPSRLFRFAQKLYPRRRQQAAFPWQQLVQNKCRRTRVLSGRLRERRLEESVRDVGEKSRCRLNSFSIYFASSFWKSPQKHLGNATIFWKIRKASWDNNPLLLTNS